MRISMRAVVVPFGSQRLERQLVPGYRPIHRVVHERHDRSRSPVHEQRQFVGTQVGHLLVASQDPHVDEHQG